jgi:hypothetical protein
VDDVQADEAEDRIIVLLIAAALCILATFIINDLARIEAAPRHFGIRQLAPSRLDLDCAFSGIAGHRCIAAGQ